MRDHEKAALVNELTALAKQYADTHQLRERIRNCVLPAIDTALAEQRKKLLQAGDLREQLREAEDKAAMLSTALVNAAIPIEAIIGCGAHKIHSITAQNELLNARNCIRAAVAANAASTTKKEEQTK